MEQVVQVHLPIPLGIDIRGQVHPGQFAGQSLLAFLRNHRLVIVVITHCVGFQNLQHPGRFVRPQHITAPLIVHHRLRGKVFRGGNVKLPVQDRITAGIFIHIGGAVPDPLAGDKHRQFDMQFHLAHLERGRMPVAHQIADQPFVIGHRFGATAIRYPCRLTNRRIIAHVINHPDKSVVQHRDRGVQVPLHPVRHCAQGQAGAGALCGDVGLLVRGQGHIRVSFGSRESLTTISWAKRHTNAVMPWPDRNIRQIIANRAMGLTLTDATSALKLATK